MTDANTTPTANTTPAATTATTPAQGQGQPDPAGNPRTYTQEECNAIAAKEAGRTDRQWMKLLGVNSKDEVQTILEQVKASRIISDRATQAEKDRDELRQKYEAAAVELSALRNAKTLAGYGVTDSDEQEFYTFKIGKLAVDGKSFEDAAKEYFGEHPYSTASVQLMPQQQVNAPDAGLHNRINAKLRGE